MKMSVENAEVTNNSHDHKMVNGEQHMNGMSNGHSDKHKSSSHKSSSKDKYRDKERSKDHKSSKSSHKDRDREKERSDKHLSSNGKDKHSSSSKSSHKDKDRENKSSSSKDPKSKDRDKERTDRDKERSDRDKERSDKDKHKSSSSSAKEKSSSSPLKEKSSSSPLKEKSSSGSSKDKPSSSSTAKDKHSSSSKDKHSSSSGSKHKSKDKDRDRDRDHKKDKYSSTSSHKHKSSSSSSRHKDSSGSKSVIKEEPEIKEEIKSPVKELSMNCERLEMSQNSSCDYSLSQFKDEECSLPIKSENDTESENNFIEVKGEPEDNQSYQNEVDSEEDIPLSKRKKADTDSEDEAPLSVRKKIKTEKKDKKKKRVKEESDFEDEEDESDYGKSKKKKIKKEIPSASAKKSTAKTKAEPESPTKGRKKKKEEEEQEVWKWWEEEKKNDGTKWSFLEHKGPLFAPPYESLPESVRFEYEGKRMKLSPEAEEVAGFYARMLDHEYTSKVAFNTNFFKDWRKTMTNKEREVIKDLHKCNFKHMAQHFQDQSEKNRNRTKEEKLTLKEKNEAVLKELGFAIIDGHKEKIGNFRIEPPGLFRGRGEHPKMGMLKKRVMPEDIIINCSKDSKIPVPPKGHHWKEVRHDNSVTWLASWTENVQNQVKYIMLNPSSKIKGEKDYMKYETARRLKNKIEKIRDTYMSEWKSKEMRIRQRAVALYFIDKLALRAGNEKDEDQADTVGCCSLRYEHVTLHEDLNGKENVVVFDFLGKDSIRYYNEVSVEKRVFKNLQLFKENKKEGDDLFDRLNTSMLNEHLKELMDGLTAKVFRTYNASFTLQNQLDELTDAVATVPEKLLAYNRANRAVAILCNHQRAVPKTHDKSMENLREKIRAKREAIADCKKEMKKAPKGSAERDKKKKQLERLEEQLTKLEIQETDKDENKTIALGTSKLNYLDPRISVAWCKKYNVPIEKIFNKTQRDKFRWAIEMADEDYVF